MPSGTKTSFGQYTVPEPIENMTLIHRHDGVSELKTVDHEPPLAVLDQEDLNEQGIDTATLVPGATDVDALGSCTANATTVAVSNLGLSLYQKYLAALAVTAPPTPFADPKSGEEAAIRFYHVETGLSKTPWPTNDDGCTGPLLTKALIDMGIITTQKVAQSVQDICSLLQTDGIAEGGPFLNAWMEPPAGTVVDGNGSASVLEAQIKQGVAGGHETYISSIEKIELSASGQVIPEKTIFRVRNSWSATWGDAGSFYIHASTLAALGSYFDFRQLVA